MGKDSTVKVSTRRKCANMIDKPIIHPFLIAKSSTKQGKRQKNIISDLSALIKRSKADGLPSELVTQLIQNKISNNRELKNSQGFTKLLDFVKKLHKACVGCQGLIFGSPSIRCYVCEDIYHIACMKPKLRKRSKPKRWQCERCHRLSEQLSDSSSEDADLKCSHCLLALEEQDLFECIKCKAPFHKTCFSEVPKGAPPLCRNCFLVKVEDPNLLDILDFYRNHKPPERKPSQAYELPRPCALELMRECIESLHVALYCQNLQFVDDLVYEHAAQERNNSALEPLIQNYPVNQMEIFDNFKALTKFGYYGPLKIEYDNEQGFLVKAMEAIPSRTLICEYSGTVHVFATQVYNRSDSIMTLLETNNATSTLVIIPEKQGNIAKYLSGINNQRKESKMRQQNVISQRFNIRGQARVLLITARKIEAGETLYYDYNEGGRNYNTRCFI